MKTYTCLAIALMLSLSAYGQNYATKIRAEFQTAGVESLRDLEWLQGTTPLISVDPVDNGRPIKADADMTVRMVIGASPESTLFAFAEASVATNNSYFIQWPTIGTNTVDGAWWYTVYFEKDGRRYWTGSGELYISPTTSTGDGVHWQEVTDGTESDPFALPLINAHLADMDNPHNVTPAQIGAITTNQLDTALNEFATLTDLNDKADKTAVASTIAGLSDIYLGINDTAANAAHANSADNAGDAGTVNGFSVEANVPDDAVFTDTIVDISGKADKSYVDSKVKTDVPANAKFTETTINNNTGAITKADIVALGIPAQDTIVDISGKADKTYVDGKVKTDVPADAVFTDTIVDISGKADKAELAEGTNWLYRAGLTGTVAFANAGNRPQAWSGSGDLIVTEISGLAPPAQVYWTLQGFSSVTLPAGTYAVGGGTLQAGMVNHFAVWQVGDTTMITFLTATEIE